jgi:tRNA modification GTPase
MTTIFAPITAIGKSGVSVIRISGPEAADCLRYFGITKNFEERKSHLRKIINPKTGSIVDIALITIFPAPNSFTGEDVVEIALHSSPYILKTIFELLSEVEGVRLAEPGEFSKIAFLNGKMDLVEAEALSDLIASETAIQHQQALNQMQGNLSKIYDQWRSELINISANIEAYIDFPDQDLPENIVDDLENQVKKIISEVETHLHDNQRGEKIRTGLSLAIIGPTNAGKSSLINYLAKSEIAIVSDIAGTTRDVVETHLEIAGIPVIIADTAGIRETNNEIEIEGIKRAIKKAENADLKILILDATDLRNWPKIDDQTLLVINKIDKAENAIPDFLARFDPIQISIKENINLDKLITTLEHQVKELASPGSSPLITRARYREALNEMLENLSYFSLTKNIELAAEDLRLAIRAIGKITGKVDVDEILDKIFAGFCIGK